jgi:hypothetical protein
MANTMVKVKITIWFLTNKHELIRTCHVITQKYVWQLLGLLCEWGAYHHCTCTKKLHVILSFITHRNVLWFVGGSTNDNHGVKKVQKVKY